MNTNDNPNNTSCSISIQSLLSTLQGETTSSKKRSCRELLRSKAIPSPQVLRVVEETRGSLTAQVLTQVHDVLLQEYAAPQNKDESSGLPLAFAYMNQLAVIFRFIQLLLLREPLTEKQKDALPEEHCQKLVSVLLQRTCQGLCDHIKLVASVDSGDDHDDEEEDSEEFDLWAVDASTTSDPRPVIGFAISWLLRINHHYAKSRVALMAPLWRGICNVLTSACSASYNLPVEIIEDAIKALATYLMEGRDRLLATSSTIGTTSTTSASAAESMLQVKLITFFVLRVTGLLKLLTNPEKTPVVHSVWELLACFRGMGPILQSRHGTMASSVVPLEIGVKIQKQVSDLAISHSQSWKGLLVPDFRADVDGNDKRMIRSSSQVLGRVLLLQSILKNAVKLKDNSQDHSDSILRTCECLLTVAMPECFGPLTLASLRQGVGQQGIVSTVIPITLQVIRDALLSIESKNHQVSSPSRQMARLFCRWLNQKHPLARELCISIVHLYLTETKDMALLCLMIRLLFDHRTKPTLRNNLSALMIRIQRSKICSVEPLVEAEVLRLLQSTNRTKKRKRSKSTPVTWKLYDYKDVQAICSILRECQNPSPSMLSVLQSFFQRTKQCIDKSKDCHIRLASAKRVAIHLAYLEALLSHCNSEQQSPEARNHHFQKLVGARISELLLVVICSVEEAGMLSATDSPSFAENKTILISSVLRLCGRACETCNSNGGDIPLGRFCRIFATFTTNATLAHSSGASGISNQQRIIMFEIARVLQSVGKAIPSTCPNQVLKDIQHTFSRVLSSGHWPLQSFAMSALSVFGSTLAACHQTILPQCLPKACIGLLQCRIQATVWRKGRKEKMDGEDLLVTHHQSRSLEDLIEPRKSESSVFPSAATLQILQGSYFLQMPTQEGRQALVIFPPGSQSIVDIRHMYAMQDCDELPDIQSLKRFAVSSTGDGTCLLEQYTEG